MFTIQVWSIQTPDLSLIFRWLLYTACLNSLGIIHKWRHAQLAFFWLFVIVKRLLTHFNKYNYTTPCVTSFFNVPLPNNVMKDETIKWKSITYQHCFELEYFAMLELTESDWLELSSSFWLKTLQPELESVPPVVAFGLGPDQRRNSFIFRWIRSIKKWCRS